MKHKRILSLLLVCVMLFSLAACGAKETETQENDAQQEDEQESGITEVTIVTTGSWLPYSLKEGETWEGVTADYENWDEWTGLEADIWKEILKRTGWKLNMIQTEFPSVFGELDAGRADIAVNHFSVNEERLEKYNASVPYSSDPQVVVVNADNTDVNTLEDLRGAKMGVTSGEASQIVVDNIKDEYDWEVTVYDGFTGFEDLVLGRIDAVAASALTAISVADANGYKYRYLDEYLESGNVAYFVQKNERGDEILAELNPVIEDMLEDGTISAILEKWLLQDMTQYIVEE